MNYVAVFIPDHVSSFWRVGEIFNDDFSLNRAKRVAYDDIVDLLWLYPFAAHKANSVFPVEGDKLDKYCGPVRRFSNLFIKYGFAYDDDASRFEVSNKLMITHYVIPALTTCRQVHVAG